MQAILATPSPAPATGRVAVRPAAGEKTLRRRFLDDLIKLPGWSGEAVVVEAGVVGLDEVAAMIERPDLLACADGRCTLAAPLLVEPGSTLVIDRTVLHLEQAAGGLVSAQGDLFISDAEILGWDSASDGPAETDLRGQQYRPWVAGLDASRTVIRNSTLAHLGYDSSGTQGLAFIKTGNAVTTGHPAVDIVTSRIDDLFFGLFTWEARGVRLLRTVFEGSHVYGIDPHDRTSDLLIAENVVRGTRDSHGVILSREIHDAIIVRNRSIDSGGAGFFLDKGNWNVTLAGNESVDNATDGMTIYDSRDVVIEHNYIAGSSNAGIRIRASADITIRANIIHDSGGAAVFAYGWSEAGRQPDAEDLQRMQPTRIMAVGNRLSRNGGGDCTIKGEVTVITPPEGLSDC